ncbi:MAG: 5-formyltetrahydrofolate cyclo-ligase [Thermoanaerobaculia bacterium]
MSDVRAEKAQLRSEFAARLAALGADDRARGSRAAQDRLVALPEVSGARRIFTCLSFGDELDTWSLIESWITEGREVYVPRADPRDGEIHVHRYPCTLRELAFGLRQPPHPRAGGGANGGIPDDAIDRTLDVAIVLGLGFDRSGYRLGYGSGYFDRFLAGRPFPAVGLAFGSQLVDRLPTAPHDVPMRAIVTAGETVRPTA